MNNERVYLTLEVTKTFFRIYSLLNSESSIPGNTKHTRFPGFDIIMTKQKQLFRKQHQAWTLETWKQ
jgi:hypothetical protein